MLQTLKPYSKKDALRVLARVTDAYLPNPGINDSADTPDEASSQVVAELRSRIGIDSDDSSAEATSRLLSELTTEMSEYALSGINISSVEARLGQIGDLPLGLYKVNFGKIFAQSEKFSITKDEVLEALHNPTAVEHLLTERFAPVGRALSLIMQQKSDHILLVQASRNSNILSIDTAWRVYLDSIKLPGSATPLTILKAFVDTYGLLMRVGGHEPTRFVLYDAFPLVLVGANQFVDPVKIINDKEYIYGSYAIFAVSPFQVIEVAICYTIDLQKYTETLRSHGRTVLYSSLLKSLKNSTIVEYI